MPDHELSYYDLLGLTPDASHDEIRTAYDSIMVRIRPNIEHDSASTIRLAAAVKEAWETLGDEDKRRAYDESLRGSRDLRRSLAAPGTIAVSRKTRRMVRSASAARAVRAPERA